MEGLQSSLDYTSNSTQVPIQDSSASKLHTAGRRSDGGVLLNNPSHSLDQFRQFYVHQHQRQEPTEPNPDPDTIPDPDPPQLGGATAVAPPNSNTTPTPLPRQEADVPSAVQCQYRECLKNHAASIGGHVVDGCGEFMPSGEEGTPEAFKCAACECHRNFHRREMEGGESRQLTTTNVYQPHNPNGINSMRVVTNHHNQTPPASSRHQHRHFPNHYSHSLASPTGPVMMAFGGRGPEESSSEDLNMFQSTGGGQHMVAVPSSYSGSKKRFRTKFTKEQKDRMHEVAEKMGWKIQKQDDEEVQQLCQELGVKRQVFKVWMHNNKQAMKKKQDQ